MSKESVAAGLGAIAADHSYPVEVFMRLSGLGIRGLREAERRGLKVRRSGRRKYVRGKDWSEYLGKRT